MMTLFLILATFCALIVLGSSRPTEHNNNREIIPEIGQERAGLTDILNPQNLANGPIATQGAAALPSPFQNLLNNTLAPNNPLKDIKLFFVTAQGAIMPASVLTSGFTGFLQQLGNMGNMFGSLGQNAEKLNPLNPNRN